MFMEYSQDVFPYDYVPTVFDNFFTSIVVNGKRIRLGLWDTAGVEDMARLRMVSYPMTVIRIYKYFLKPRTSSFIPFHRRTIARRTLRRIDEKKPDVVSSNI